MTDFKHTENRMPGWWTDRNTSDWERVKAALERDWQQTKADFSGVGGQEPDREVAVSAIRSTGSDSAPRLEAKGDSGDPVSAARKREEEARENMTLEAAKTAVTIAKARGEIIKEQEKLAGKVDEVRRDQASRQEKASEKISAATSEATETIAEAQGRIEEAGARRDAAVETWREAEQAVRYGYGVRSRYPAESVWDAEVEEKLRVEWDGLETGRAWDVAGEGIQRGWDSAGKKP